ncbi:hypothetical protein, partial [Nostoc sp.]|uniref:hypothetical protein n=1 Tax=Nostoc sp. TaxID=1180 RepID=UPI002FEF447C
NESLNWMNPPLNSVNESLNWMNPPLNSVNESLNSINQSRKSKCLALAKVIHAPASLLPSGLYLVLLISSQLQSGN